MEASWNDTHRRRLHREVARPGVLVASFVVASIQVGATTLLEKNLDDLVVQADAIVVGTVSETEARYGSDGDIYTLVTLTDLRVVLGQLDGSSLKLQFPGGRIGGDTLLVPGSPRFALKERVLLFVRGNGQQLVPVVGWTQGVFRFERQSAGGKPKVVDHDRNPVLAVRGNELVKRTIHPPDAAIVAAPGRSRAPAGHAGAADDDHGAPAAEAAVAAESRESMDADTFLRVIERKIAERRAVGKRVESIGAASSLDAASGTDAAPRQR